MTNDKSIYPRVVVKFHDHVKLPDRMDLDCANFFSRARIPEWENYLENFPGITIKNLFTSIEPEKVRDLVKKARRSDPTYQARELLNYFAIDCPPEIVIKELLQILSASNAVELAYMETGLFAPPSTDNGYANFGWEQEYLYPAPIGIDARNAWGFPGGDGSGSVKFIDIEKGWVIDHEAVRFKTFRNTGINRSSFADHGIGVLGIIMMQPNDEGAIGITPKANGYVMSQYRPDGSLNTADAIMTAIDHLNHGDILLLEAQVLESGETENLWPVETQDAIYSVIRLATALGIIVIEAGGNGNLNGIEGNDLSQFNLYGKKALDPGSLDFRDSGAILVAASSLTAPHQRISFSNYGDRINCFASGEYIVTAGNHPGYSGMVINMYTGKFGGTSSATAIIAGAAISVQSIKEANHHSRFDPVQMRQILSDEALGTRSAHGREVDKIGVMPDLKKIIDHVMGIPNKIENKFKRYIEG